MKRFPLPVLAACSFIFLAGAGLYAQAAADRTGQSPVSDSPAGKSGAAEEFIPLRRITIYSSGVAFFEYAGTLSKGAALKLPFNANAVNDALKSLVINDPSSAAPLVHYPSEYTLYRTLKDLRIDLSGDPGIPQIIGGLKGAELEVYTADRPEGPPAVGRIIGIEYRPALSAVEYGDPPVPEPYLSLYTAQGIRITAFKDIFSFSFKDPGINADLNRALDLIMASRNLETRDLTVELPGGGSRLVSISYVIPAPVWKVSYRLDLSRSSPADSRPNALLQGWAIVDNDGGTDWQDVELSLAAGRPVSFIQNLYPPYYVNRPTLPLAIAGTAEAETWESGKDGNAENAGGSQARKALRAEAYAEEKREIAQGSVPAAAPSVAGGVVDTARAAALGDQFAFTIKTPVSLNRRQSAMLPLVEGNVTAVKLLILSGERALGRTVHPYLGAELHNTTGMKLPAGPLTIYDGGAYAGDALIEFFPEQEKRLISYGEDLSVTGNAGFTNSQILSMVTISGGIMTINRKRIYERTYTIRNASAEPKRLVLEHPITPGAVLTEPAKFDERTGGFYRFYQTLPANRELLFTVKEEQPYMEKAGLTMARMDILAGYASNQELPAHIRTAMQRAVELKQKADAAKNVQTDLETQQTRLISEQDRIRRNLEAAGNQTQQGQEYLKRLVAMDEEIDGLTLKIGDARKNAQAAQADLEAYIASLNL
ncbi:MAG: DUF4139 domain-containing protein [Treponema sp.]|jgi:hypothetical protein|nr:DUF4139 domain-containing protein [Treponema sp.]